MYLVLGFGIHLHIIYTYSFSDTHALVKLLDEDKTAIVPVTRVKKKETLEYNGSCSVLWSNKKTYKAFLL